MLCMHIAILDSNGMHRVTQKKFKGRFVIHSRMCCALNRLTSQPVHDGWVKISTLQIEV